MSDNTNCLEGLRCPKCKAREPFYIMLKSACAVVYDNGVSEVTEPDWDSNSPARCISCDGDWREVGDFREEST